jgi:hypothetical protein
MKAWLATWSIMCFMASAIQAQMYDGKAGLSPCPCANPPIKPGSPQRTRQAGETRWQFSHRLQAGWEYDSNIYEASTRHTASGSPRFLLSTRGNRNDKRWQLHYNYSAALQTYPAHGDENKLIHDLGGQLGVRVKPWLQVTTRANAFLKLYLENATDYATTSGTLIASLSLPHKIFVDFVAETGQLDYAATDLYDFTHRGFEVTLRPSLLSNGSLQATLNRRLLRYPSQFFICVARPGSPVTILHERDVLTTWRAAMSFGRKILTQISIEAQANRSNSSVYEFNRLRVNGLVGFRLMRRWFVRAAGVYQHKRYPEALAPLCLLELDTEREQSNFLVADLSRDLTSNVSLLMRVALYDNESTLRGRFYRKMLYFAGLEIRL